MAYFSNSHFIFLDYSEIFPLNPYPPGIVKKKKKIECIYVIRAFHIYI